MEVLVILVPLALGLGLIGLLGFLWSLKSGQYDDLEGAAWRAIAEDEPTPESSQCGPWAVQGNKKPASLDWEQRVTGPVAQSENRFSTPGRGIIEPSINARRKSGH
jgi:cbb3-type cytochrome oxidase maturation protein